MGRLLVVTVLGFILISTTAASADSGRVSTTGSASDSGEVDLDNLLINDRTEVKLNGKRCHYDEVPDNAVISYLELAADKKTVVKIHFRTKK